MKKRLYAVLKLKDTFYHEYDFGSTTYLDGQVLIEADRADPSRQGAEDDEQEGWAGFKAIVRWLAIGILLRYLRSRQLLLVK